MAGGVRPEPRGPPPRRDQPVPRGRRRIRAAAANPFAPPADHRPPNPFLDEVAPAAPNPFAPPPPPPPAAEPDAPRKWQLLGRGLTVTGSYAKVLFVDEVASAYCQFGPLTRLPAGAAHARAVPGAAGRAAPGGHHLHRDDRRRARRRAGPAAGRRGLRRPRGPRVHRRRGLPRGRRPAGRDECRDPGVLGRRRVRPRRGRRAVPRHAPGAGLIRMRRLPGPRRRSSRRSSRGSSRSPSWP